MTMTKKERAAEAVRRLKEIYPDAVCSLTYSGERPYELVISTRLSAQCTDARVNIVTKDLFAKYRSLEDFANAKLEDVEEIVKPCGFYHMKARDIIGMCREMLDRFDGRVPDTIEELVTLPGVGRKTANLIVGDIYGKDSVVTDTHCIRICGSVLSSRQARGTGQSTSHQAYRHGRRHAGNQLQHHCCRHAYGNDYHTHQDVGNRTAVEIPEKFRSSNQTDRSHKHRCT